MSAPLGNIFALGNDGGRPAFFDSPEEFRDRVVEYLESYHSDEKNPLIGYKPTTTGLALWLGFKSRQSLYDYKEKKEYSYIIKKALLFIEMEYEQLLESKGSTGAIFALKNMGWSDKSLLDMNANHSGEIKIVREIKK